MRGSTVIRTAALWLVVACASGGAMGGSAGIRDPNVITAAELAKENSSNVYDAIQHLRPEMLRQRPSNESSSLSASASYAVRVYLDTSPLGGIDELRTIPLGTIKQIQYLTAPQAMQRFGSGNAGGAIVLTSH